MAPGFVTTFVESQYRFLKAVAEWTLCAPTFKDGLHIQEVMQAALCSSEEQGWVTIADIHRKD